LRRKGSRSTGTQAGNRPVTRGRRFNLTLQTMTLLLTVLVVLISLGVVFAASVVTVSRHTEAIIEAHLLDLARTLARMQQVRIAMDDLDPARNLQPIVDRMTQTTQAELVVIMNTDGLRYAHTYPDMAYKLFTGGDEDRALKGEEYVSKTTGRFGPIVHAFTPIYNSAGQQVGVAVVGVFRDTLAETITQVARPVYLATTAGLLVGIMGAVFLAKRVKATIFGLEPREIATLLQEREAMLGSIREGILAIDRQHRITLVNEAGRRLLGLKGEVMGTSIQEALPNTRLPMVLETREPEFDHEQVLGETVVLTSTVPIIVDGEVVGAIASFRDKTEVTRLAEELTGVKKFVEALRAQTHEFMNKLHTIAGLIQLGSYDEAVDYIFQTTRIQQDVVSFILKKVKDPATAGLLLGKLSEARERGVVVEIDPKSLLTSLPAHFDSNAVAVVLGNLLQNAIEAVEKLEKSRRRVTVFLYQDSEQLTIKVKDQGQGIPAGILPKMYEKGFTTKSGRGNYGIGLPLVKREVEAVGGQIKVDSSPTEGTCFTITIPMHLNVNDKREE